MRAAIIGTGTIARQHLQCLNELPAVKIAGVCDLSSVMAESTAERFGVSRWFTDHRDMLNQVRPDLVHVTAPSPTHFRLAMDCLESGVHVIVEKPITTTLEELKLLTEVARTNGLHLVEDHNYVFNKPIQQILRWVESGDFGEVVQVECMICLNILGSGSALADPDAAHPSLRLPGGAISEFLTHLASIVHLFLGDHVSVASVWEKREPRSTLPRDEFRAVIKARRGVGTVAFSTHAQPDVFWVRVYGTRMRAETNLFEPRLTVHRIRGGPRALTPMLNSISEARAVRRAAFAGLWRKLSGGPGAYEGLWELVRRTYIAVANGLEPPVSLNDIEEVARLFHDLVNEEYTI